MAQPPTQLMTGLRDIFTTYFNSEGLNDFALDLGVDYENLAGGTRSAKARELALHLWRHSLIETLAELGPERRPDIDWSILDPYKPQTAPPALPATTTTVLEHTDLQRLASILSANPLFDTPDSRKTVLVLSGVSAIVNLDLNGPAYNVASSLLVKLNEFGEIKPGDTAIGRLLRYISSDPALPPAHKDAMAGIAAKYGIPLN